MQLETITIGQVQALQRALGLGAIVIDWDIDYELGRGIGKGKDRYLWTKDGRKITVWISSDGGFGASQGRDPDPEYFELKNQSTEEA